MCTLSTKFLNLCMHLWIFIWRLSRVFSGILKGLQGTNWFILRTDHMRQVINYSHTLMYIGLEISTNVGLFLYILFLLVVILWYGATKSRKLLLDQALRWNIMSWQRVSLMLLGLNTYWKNYMNPCPCPYYYVLIKVPQI